jgi:hypothetical protein
MLALLLLAAAAPDPAVTAGPVEKLHKRVVEAIRNCPEAQAGDVVVCAPDRGIAEGYRIPKLDARFAEGALRPSGRGTVSDGAGAGGTGSCTAIGAGGSLGCSRRDYEAWSAAKRQRKAEAGQ